MNAEAWRCVKLLFIIRRFTRSLRDKIDKMLRGLHGIHIIDSNY